MDADHQGYCDVCEELVPLNIDGELIVGCSCLNCPYGFERDEEPQELDFHE